MSVTFIDAICAWFIHRSVCTDAVEYVNNCVRGLTDLRIPNISEMAANFDGKLTLN